MKKDIVEDLINKNPVLLSGMVTKEHITIVLKKLKEVLDNNIKGDIVELGCNAGTTSVFIRRLLDIYKSNKKFHVYDSFEGLPEKHAKDISHRGSHAEIIKYNFDKGACDTKKEKLIKNFEESSLELPIIHEGWFSEIPDEKYPKKIAFAFFDGDFYTSIIDSFKKVYPRMTKGAIVTIHDYGWELLPGVKKACDDFLEDKPEKAFMEGWSCIGVMVKK